MSSHPGQSSSDERAQNGAARREPEYDSLFQRFENDEVLARLKALDARAQRKGIKSLDPSKNALIRLGTEIDDQGRVTKNSYGVFHLSWRAERDG
ncbi:MAG: hypothetical protein JJE04_13370, partial [Acidobacteriia bacterium]|nr:hypothetical protein [Terriglobia bacterium]